MKIETPRMGRREMKRESPRMGSKGMKRETLNMGVGGRWVGGGEDGMWVWVWGCGWV